MGRFFNYHKGKFLKLLIYNAFEAGVSENNSLRLFYCDYCSIVTISRIPKFLKMFYLLKESKMFIKL